MKSQGWLSELTHWKALAKTCWGSSKALVIMSELPSMLLMASDSLSHPTATYSHWLSSRKVILKCKMKQANCWGCELIANLNRLYLITVVDQVVKHWFLLPSCRILGKYMCTIFERVSLFKLNNDYEGQEYRTLKYTKTKSSSEHC